MKTTLTTLAAALALLAAAQVQAGPFILAGTDADDHGSFDGTNNVDGWFFMQRSLENMFGAVTNGSTQVVFLGSDSGSSAGDAAQSAFDQSSLVGAGWTSTFVNDAAGIASFLQGGGVGAGIIMLDSGFNVGGGLDSAEQQALVDNASFIDGFVDAGGGLFSQANGYGWLSALIPGLTVVDEFTTGISLTAAGNAAFPGLSDADLSAGPYHNSFASVGPIPILGIGSSTQNPVILGAVSGGITDPDPIPGIPEPSTYALMLAGLAGVGWVTRRRGRLPNGRG